MARKTTAMVSLVVVCLFALPQSGATGNMHHNTCELDFSPHGHHMHDGHKHYHHMMASPEGHYHGHDWHPAGHTHGMASHDDHGHDGMGGHEGHMSDGHDEHNDEAHHDPCMQTGPHRHQVDQPELPQPTLEEAAFGNPDDYIFINGEPYYKNTNKETDILEIHSDHDAKLLNLPGSGKPHDPYIVSNYFITEDLYISNTDACYVVRDNIITGNHLEGGFIKEPLINFLSTLIDQQRARLAQAEDNLRQTQIEKENIETERNNYIAEQKEWTETYWVPALQRWDEAKREYRDVRDNYYYHEDQHQQQYEQERDEYQMLLTRFTGNEAEFQVYLDEFQATNGANHDNIYGITETETRNYLETLAELNHKHDLLQQAHTELKAAIQKKMDTGKIVGEYYREYYDNWLPNRQALDEQWNSIRWQEIEDQNQVRDEENQLQPLLDQATQGNTVEYLGEYYESVRDLILEFLDLLEPERIEDAQLSLNWNGNCVYAYHNVIDDLRVNENNQRTGYATGGIIEDNRIFEVGQLRHYDGIFRDNTVGDKTIWTNYLKGGHQEVKRTMNVDGFNQGIITNNVIFGGIDLDYHGHHHSAGFFAPHSHYHGNIKERLYNDQGELHHDHTQRWTSVEFSHNLIIDPFGQGLWYDDENHEGDDRIANSENVEQLNEPHVHRSHINIHSNTILGQLVVEIFNADGIALWSDDYSEVEYDLEGRVIDSIKHLGAEIINSHPHRNTGWLDINNNRIVTPDGGSAMYLYKVKEADIQMHNNEMLAVYTERGAPSHLTPERFQTANRAEITSWETTPYDDNLAAILLLDAKDTSFDFKGNYANGYDYSVVAMRMASDVFYQEHQDNDWPGIAWHRDDQRDKESDWQFVYDLMPNDSARHMAGLLDHPSDALE